MFEPGSLWSILKEATARALGRGALQPIPTHLHQVPDAGLSFLVRAVDSLLRKAAAKREEDTLPTRTDSNPFLPYDPEMFVADIFETHVALLNKFNVVDQHLLLVTRQFEDQDLPLTAPDFAALWACMAEYDALGFYNGGVVAGASQQHKHLQLVPLPLAPSGPDLPLGPLLDAALRDHSPKARLPFAHRLAPVDPGWIRSPTAAAAPSEELYLRLRDEMNVKEEPYNLLVTRDWMLLVPRSREHFESISINALGFAGSFFVRDEDEFSLVRERGPMNILRSVAKPA